MMGIILWSCACISSNTPSMRTESRGAGRPRGSWAEAVPATARLRQDAPISRFRTLRVGAWCILSSSGCVIAAERTAIGRPLRPPGRRATFPE